MFEIDQKARRLSQEEKEQIIKDYFRDGEDRVEEAEKKAENISPNKANKNKKRVDIYKFLFSLLPSPLLTK